MAPQAWTYLGKLYLGGTGDVRHIEPREMMIRVHMSVLFSSFKYVSVNITRYKVLL